MLVHLVQTTTITGGAVAFEITYDNVNWIGVSADCVIDPTSTTLATISLPYTLQANTNKGFLILAKGAQGLRIKLSTAITGTGSVTPNYALLAYNAVQQTTAVQSGTWTVQPGNTQNTTPWKVDGSGVTQPVNGTVTANAGSGTFAISASSLPLPTGAATESTLAKLPVGQGSTTSGQSGSLTQGAVTTAAPSYTTAQTSPLSLNTAGGLRVDGSGVTQPVSGTVTITPSGTQTVSGTVTANAGTGPFPVAGSVSAGSAVPNPVVIGGQFGGNAKFLALDTNGQPTVNQGATGSGGTSGWFVQGQSAAAAGLAGNPLTIGGRDASGNAQFIGGNNSGVFAQGPAADNAALAGNPLRTGVSDGTNIQTWKQADGVGSTISNTGLGAMGLHMFHTSNQWIAVKDGSAAGTAGASTSNAMAVTSYGYNGGTLDLWRNNVNVSVRSSGTAVTAQTVNTDITTYNGAAFMYHNNVSNYNGGTLTVSLQWKDANGQFVTIPGATTGALTSGADIILAVGPSAWPANTATAFYVNYHLPRTIRLVETVATATITMGGAYDITSQ